MVALGWCFGEQAYLRSSWNVLDGLLVLISIIDILVSLVSDSGTKILGMLRVLRLLRTLRPLRCAQLGVLHRDTPNDQLPTTEQEPYLPLIPACDPHKEPRHRSV